MKNVEDKEQIIDQAVNTCFIFDLQMNNNCRSVGLRMQIFKDDMLGVLAKSTIIFDWSLGGFTQSS